MCTRVEFNGSRFKNVGFANQVHPCAISTVCRRCRGFRFQDDATFLFRFLRVHIHETFDENLVDQLHQRVIVLFHQQLNSTGAVPQLPEHVSHAIERTVKKYLRTRYARERMIMSRMTGDISISSSVREKASSLIHDLSEIAFNELIARQNQFSDLVIIFVETSDLFHRVCFNLSLV